MFVSLGISAVEGTECSKLLSLAKKIGTYWSIAQSKTGCGNTGSSRARFFRVIPKTVWGPSEIDCISPSRTTSCRRSRLRWFCRKRLQLWRSQCQLDLRFLVWCLTIRLISVVSQYVFDQRTKALGFAEFFAFEDCGPLAIFPDRLLYPLLFRIDLNPLSPKVVLFVGDSMR